MRRMTIGILGVTVLACTGCGSSSKGLARAPRPAAPVNLTVYINDKQVSVSPSSIGAGPITFIVTNQASRAQSLQIEPEGSASGGPLADTGPISPQATAEVKVDAPEGNYTVSTAGAGTSQAQTATGTGVHAARLHIGPPRPSADNLVLQP
jgi:hypothetical protein